LPDTLRTARTAGTAVVTGASSGIGAATVRRLCSDGFHVVAGARRRDRLDALAAETGCTPVTLDVTDDASVAALVGGLNGCDVLVNSAGGAKGLEPVAEADLADWRWMYEVNVIGTARMTRALLPMLISGGNGHVLVVGSTAGHEVYAGGAGYCAAKAGVSAVCRTLRLELLGQPVRVTEIAPGMVHTEEFSLVRFAGDADRAGAVYRGVDGPLVASDIADSIAWALTRPAHVDVDLMIVRPRAQADSRTVHRNASGNPDAGQ